MHIVLNLRKRQFYYELREEENYFPFNRIFYCDSSIAEMVKQNTRLISVYQQKRKYRQLDLQVAKSS